MNLEYLAVRHATDVSECRRAVFRMSSRLKLNDVAAGQAAIIISEIASNLVKHAGGGDVVVRPLCREGQAGIEILALDKGPGMPNIAACLRDGFSSTGTAGTGLGAIQRLSSNWEVYSRPEKGTALVARLWSGPLEETADGRFFSAGGVSMPHPQEKTTGDSWSVVCGADHCAVMVADGLGHGQLAAEGADAARKVFERRPFAEPAELLGLAHQALRGTRGAAAAVARIDRSHSRVDYAGVGNIAGVLLGPEEFLKNMVSMNGTLGHAVRRTSAFQYKWPPDGLLLMYSDGLSTHWSLDAYPGLLSCDPTLIAGVLCRDFRRPHDDVTVVAVKGRTAAAEHLTRG